MIHEPPRDYVPVSRQPSLSDRICNWLAAHLTEVFAAFAAAILILGMMGRGQ